VRRRNEHEREVGAFLRRELRGKWRLTLPGGTGHETYFAHREDGGRKLFIKLGTPVERVEAIARLRLTPVVVRAGRMEDGTTMLVQEYVEGRNPERADYQRDLQQVAAVIRAMHNSEDVRATLPGVVLDGYAEAGLRALASVRARWEGVREQVDGGAYSVEEGLAELEERIKEFRGEELVASHGDICNANWLLTPEGGLYLVDLDAMTMDDPALDVGATLWWYYAEETWREFLEVAGYRDDGEFRERMWARLALHCLSITLPRAGSFDRFDGKDYSERLVDFEAALRRKSNPQG
jgi:thiamine kinase-like enzyme